MRQAAEYARERGLKTCSENHGYLLQDSARMLELFAAVDHPNYGFLCDMGNFTVVDEDCATAVSALSDYIVHVHAKDMLVRSGMNFDPGRGQILSAIRKSGYDGYVSLEFEGMEPVLEGVEIGTQNLQHMIKVIGEGQRYV